MKVTTVSANIRFSKDTGQGAWKVVELGAEASIDANEGWQAAQGQLYADLGQQLKSLWGHGQKAQEATTEAAETPVQPVPPSAPAHYCQAHQTEFKRFEKDGRVWFSHKGPDGKWCKEK
jgi:hypothetical protein